VPPAKIGVSSPLGLPGPERSAGPLATSHPAPRAIDREHLLARLEHLRSVLPVFANELAGDPGETSQLCIENRELLEEVRRVRQQRGESIPFATMASMLGEARTALSRRRTDSWS
jgi:hypothetical protein